MESLQNFVQNFYLCRIKRNLPNMNLLQILHKTVVRIRKKILPKMELPQNFVQTFTCVVSELSTQTELLQFFVQS